MAAKIAVLCIFVIINNTTIIIGLKSISASEAVIGDLFSLGAAINEL